MRNKPRASVKKMKDKGVKFQIKDVSDSKALPKKYLVIPAAMNDNPESLQRHLEKWNEKLNRRGDRIKTPVVLYRLTRVIKTVELCVETEDNDLDRPNALSRP